VASAAARLRHLAEQAEPGSDAQLQLVQTFAAVQPGGEHATWLRGLLEGTEVLEGLAVDTDMRWTLLTALARVGAATEAEIEAEHQRDRTATGREHAAEALAAIPTPEAKAAAWRRAQEEDLPNSVLASVAAGFTASTDRALLGPYIEPYFAMLDTVDRKGSHAIVEILVRGFYPLTLASQELHDATQRWLDEHPDAPAALRRLVVENRDPVARALKAQARDADA
jgi:aminopeptidase N